MIYLASPYSHPNRTIRARRFTMTRDFLFEQMKTTPAIFSPIVYCHQFARDMQAAVDHESWKGLNDDMLNLMSALWVLKLPGWDESLGVRYEIARATQRNVEIVEWEFNLYAPF